MVPLVAFCIIGCLVSSCEEEGEGVHYAPEITSPAFGASNQSLEVILEWHDTDPAGTLGDVERFDVYLGTAEGNLERVATDLLVFSEEKATFKCSSLELNTTYFWRVVAKANGKSRKSEIGKFVTAGELQKINVGGRTLMVYPGDYIHPDESSLIGYDLGPNVDATSWEDGEANTRIILDHYGESYSRGWGVAADHCDKLNAYGYSDWYLPAILEIDAVVIENNLLKYGYVYWSSTVAEADYSLRVMGKSNQHDPSTGFDNLDPLSDARCRCVRKD